MPCSLDILLINYIINAPLRVWHTRYSAGCEIKSIFDFSRTHLYSSCGAIQVKCTTKYRDATLANSKSDIILSIRLTILNIVVINAYVIDHPTGASRILDTGHESTGGDRTREEPFYSQTFTPNIGGIHTRREPRRPCRTTYSNCYFR